MEELENLGLLHNRAQNLNYNDKKELDDIIQKSRMYINSYFPLKPTYALEVEHISFKPLYVNSYTGGENYEKAWQDGKNKLINILDTRITEIKLLENQKKESIKNQSVAKTSIVQTKHKIGEKEQSSSKTLVIIPIVLGIIGGAFYFGKFFGENRFDHEKIELANEKQLLNKKLDSVFHENANLKTTVDFLKQFAPPEVTEDSNLYSISVSYSATLAIFDGKVEISAQKKDNSAELFFIGLNKLWKSSNEKIIDNKVIVSKGDKINIQEKNGKTWSIHVIEITPKVKMEIYPLF